MAVDKMVSVDIAMVFQLSSFPFKPVREGATLEFAADNNVARCFLCPVRLHTSGPLLVKTLYEVVFHLLNGFVYLVFTLIDDCLVPAFDGIGLTCNYLKVIQHTMVAQKLLSRLLSTGEVLHVCSSRL